MTELATSDDVLLKGKITIRQPVKGFRVTSDTLLLAAAIQAHPGESLLDLGCGVGAGLIAAGLRLPEVKCLGIEKEQDNFALAQFNANENNMTQRMDLYHGNIADTKLFHMVGTVDHVMLNPPYYPATSHTLAKGALRRVARQTDELELGDWIQSANRFLKPKGTVTVIYPVSGMNYIVNFLTAFAGGITILPLQPRTSQEPNRVIIQATKGSTAPLRLLSALVLHQDNTNEYTQEAASYINAQKGIFPR